MTDDVWATERYQATIENPILNGLTETYGSYANVVEKVKAYLDIWSAETPDLVITIRRMK